MTEKEWGLLPPLLPPSKRGGRQRTTDLREVLNAILYIASSGCQWRMLPKDFPPMSTVQGYFYAWRASGLWQKINYLLVMAARELEGREAGPTAGVIDSQSVKTTESGGLCGYDAGKKIKGRKRHIITDTLGLMLFVVIHAADIQDRDGAPAVLQAIRYHFPWLRHVFADGGYAGDKLRAAMAGHGEWTIEIIKRRDTAKGFEVLPRRWVVERTFAWLGRCRRLAKDWEATIESSTAWTVSASKRRYKRRDRIEIMFERLKDWRRVATRYDRCPTVFLSVKRVCVYPSRPRLACRSNRPNTYKRLLLSLHILSCDPQPVHT